MNIFRIFGIGSTRILIKNCCVNGTVQKVKRCWWLSVKTKPVRLYASRENTIHPHIIWFDYCVDNISYMGKLYIPLRYRVPQAGEVIRVYYDPEKPQNYACYAFGPGHNLIGW